MAQGSASILAPMLGTFTLARAGSGVLWAGCLALCFVAAVLHSRITARARPRAAFVETISSA